MCIIKIQVPHENIICVISPYTKPKRSLSTYIFTSQKGANNCGEAYTFNSNSLIYFKLQGEVYSIAKVGYIVSQSQISI